MYVLYIYLYLRLTFQLERWVLINLNDKSIKKGREYPDLFMNVYIEKTTINPNI